MDNNPIGFVFRSTKLVIIERLLLLAERYVITIEVESRPLTHQSKLFHLQCRPQKDDVQSFHIVF